MILVLVIEVIVVGSLVLLATGKGIEQALPFFVFVTVLLPVEAQFRIPGLFTVTPQRVAVATLAVLYILVRRGDGETTPLATTPFKYVLMLQIVWCVISTANSVVPADSLKKMSFEVLEYYLMYYILVRTITQIKTIQNMMRAMVLAVFVACIFGSFEAYTSWRVAGLFPHLDISRFSWVTDSGHGFHSTFTDPHLFGAAISFAIVETFYLLALSKRNGERLYLSTAILLMFLNVYKVVERGPWLALALGIALLFFIGNGATRKGLITIAAITVLILVARPGIRQTISAVYQETADNNDPNNLKGKSYEYRYALWHVAVNALDESTLREMWGYGLESFYSLHLTAPFYTNPAYPFESCDSSWVELMVETGYVGLLIIAILLIKPAVLLVRNLRTIPRPDNYLCGILFINMVQYYFMMTNVAIYGWGQTGYMLWTWIALAVVYPALVERDLPASEEPQPITTESKFAKQGPTPAWARTGLPAEKPSLNRRPSKSPTSEVRYGF